MADCCEWNSGMDSLEHCQEILAHPSRVPEQTERAIFFDNGYIVKEAAIGVDWIVRFREALLNMKWVIDGQEAKHPWPEVFQIRMPPDWSDAHTSMPENQEES